MNFNADIDALVHQNPPDGGVTDFLDLFYVFDLGIDDPVAVLEKRRQRPDGDVAILVDGKTEHGAAVFQVPLRIIGPAAEKRHTEWGAADDHWPYSAASSSSRISRL